MVDYDLSESALISLVTLALEGQPSLRLAPTNSRSMGDVLSGRRTRPVRLEREGDSLTVDLNISIDFGKPAHEMAQSVQKMVAEVLTTATGLKIKAVNVSVVSVEYRESSAA
jgi:uncharacterized alkaline shock family protein YloU